MHLNQYIVTYLPCRIALADLDGSIPECAQVCALHIEPHLEALRKIEMVVSTTRMKPRSTRMQTLA